MSKRWFLLLSMMSSVPVLGQLTAPSTQPQTDAVALGDVFESRVAGIETRPPAGGTLVRQLNSGDIVRFVYTDRNWDLKVKMVHLAKRMPLSLEPTGNLSGGLLEMTVEQLKASNPSADVLMQEVKDVGSQKVGLIAARYNVGVDRALTQQAIFRSDDNQTFYILQFVTPAQKKQDEASGDDPKEVLAKQTFDAVLPTVKLLDRQDLKREQDDRLFRTRELFVAWNENKMRSVLVPEQYLRVIRDSKDVGYLRITEQPAEHSGHEGVEVELRSHVEAQPQADAPATPPVPVPAVGQVIPSTPGLPSAPAHPSRLDRMAKLFVTFDRMHEDWSITTTSDDGRLGPVTTTELGNSDKEIRRVLDRQAVASGATPDEKDRKQPPVRTTEHYTLSVSTYAKVRTGVPVNRELPVFYLPQALGHLLPRLLPLEETRTYMFASYVSDQHEVMARYIDVLREQNVVLDGKPMRAVPVRDRIGVEGSATTHYLTTAGQWLGSVNEEQKIMVLPSDEMEIKQIWKDAKVGGDAGDAGAGVGKVR